MTQGRGGGVGGVRPAKQNAKCLGLDIQIIPSKLITTNPTHLACYHKGNQNKEYSGLWFGSQCLFTMKGDLIILTSIYLLREAAQDRSRASETRKENIDF